MEDPFLLAVPPGHALAKRKRVSLDDLEDEPVLLLDDGHCLRTQALELCTRGGAREAAFRATSLATLAQMVSAGSGVTLLPKLAVPVENRRGQLEVRPIEKAPSRLVVLAYRPRNPYASTLREVATAMKKAVA
jgi:LysR family hydrogen peroxide-inducible transcriptional activator